MEINLEWWISWLWKGSSCKFGSRKEHTKVSIELHVGDVAIVISEGPRLQLYFITVPS